MINKPQAQTTPGSVPIGGECSTSADCANGANCYGVTSDTIETCGSFQASCTSDDQCATNTCNNGLCNGYLASSLYNLPSSTATAN